jgi:hypothetical protein
MPPEEIVKISIGLGWALGLVSFAIFSIGGFVFLYEVIKAEQAVKGQVPVPENDIFPGLFVMIAVPSLVMSIGVGLLFTWSFRLLMFFVLQEPA